MTTARQLRQTALSLPEAEDAGQAGRTSYVVRGASFAALTNDGEHVQLWLSGDDVDSVLAEHPGAERLTRGTLVIGARLRIADINGQQLNHWVRRAWKHRAPKRLVASAEAAARAEPGAGELPASIGRPATRALAEAGITTLDGVARLSDAELSSLHGVGPKAVAILRRAIAERS